jgi:hypothetical protein
MRHPYPFIRRVLAAATATGVVLATAALGAPAVGADPPKPFAPSVGTYTAAAANTLLVQAKGTEATVTVTTAEPTAITVAHRPVSAVAAASPPVGASPSAAIPTGGRPLTIAGDVQFHRNYATTHEHKLTGLTSNTTYDVTVTAETRSGQQHTMKTSFTTLNKRIRITLESIDIKDDGDLIGDGEAQWSVDLTWTSGAGPSSPQRYCYPIPCAWGDVGEVRITPRNSAGELPVIIFAEQNFDRFPDSVSLKVGARERDDVDLLPQLVECITAIVDGGCVLGDETPTTWRVPQGVENASKRLTVRGDDTDTGFESVLTFHMEVFHDNTPYPAPKRNVPHSTWR